jgi:uncharacterized membrane protein YagU involved in acid resistance
MESARENGLVARAAARGAVGAMAMTGFRTVASELGLLHQAPPEEIAKHGLPSVFTKLPRKHRKEAIQLAHWGYGAAAGAAFALLPERMRRHLWAGPIYGLAIWVLFEAGLAPLLGLRVTERKLGERATLAADHLLYGLVVAARPRRV